MIDLTTPCVHRLRAGRLETKLRCAGCFATPLFLLVLGSTIGQAQGVPDPTPQPSTTLASQFFEHDFVNVFAFGSGVYDSALPELTATSSKYGSAIGYDVGGGLTLGHEVSGGNISLSYRGDYRHYEANTFSNGTNQNLSLLYSKRLSRQWSILLQGGGGIVQYGGQIYNESPVGANVLTNPLSSQSRFANAGITAIYEQSRRLSYTVGGQFFYNSYNYAGAASSKGGTGTASINYRTTSRTTIGGSYSYSYFTYGGMVGQSEINTGYLTLQHTFPSHWIASVSAGASRSHTHGIITQPITLLLGQQLVSGFITGPYNHTSISPSYQGSLSHNLRHSYFSISAGQGVNAGNGTFLTSRNQYASAALSATHRLSNFSLGGYLLALDQLGQLSESALLQLRFQRFLWISNFPLCIR